MQSPGIVELLDFCDCTARAGISPADGICETCACRAKTSGRDSEQEGYDGFQCRWSSTKLQERFFVVVARSSSRRLRRRGPYSEETYAMQKFKTEA